MKKVQRQMMEDHLDEHHYDFCWSCMRSDGAIDWGHIISQKRRPDLRADPRNMKRVCRARCHELQELGEWDELMNGEEMVEYIQEHEPELLEIKSLRKDLASKPTTEMSIQQLHESILDELHKGPNTVSGICLDGDLYKPAVIAGVVNLSREKKIKKYNEEPLNEDVWEIVKPKRKRSHGTRVIFPGEDLFI